MLRQHLSLVSKCISWNPAQFARNIRSQNAQQRAQLQAQQQAERLRQIEVSRMSIAAATFLLEHVRWKKKAYKSAREEIAEIVEMATYMLDRLGGSNDLSWSQLGPVLDAQCDSPDQRRQQLAQAVLYLLQHGRCCHPDGEWTADSLGQLYSQIVAREV